MNDAYRDDLEAALARASDLEREIAELRRRNAELESSDPTDEASVNARRLAAALQREREEAQIRDERKLDEAAWKEAQIRHHQAFELAKRSRPIVMPSPVEPVDVRRAISAVILLVALFGGICAAIANLVVLEAAAYTLLFALAVFFDRAAGSGARKPRGSLR